MNNRSAPPMDPNPSEAMACRNGGTISVIGVYGGIIDKFPWARS
jgi:hypothetical protein